MSNEAFQLLLRGGVSFDKSKTANVALFQKNTSKSQSTPKAIVNGEIPQELDFFKYAQSHGKRKQPDANPKTNKRPRVEGRDSDSDRSEDDEDDGEDLPAPVRHRIATKGTNVPEPIASFSELQSYSLPSHILSNISKMNYKTPTSVQSQCIPILLKHRDLVAISPTGTGKTMAYLLPIFSQLSAPISSASVDAGEGVRALIIVPTRELADQIFNECLKLAQGRKWKIVLFSKATANALSNKSARDKVDIIISTPLRLVAALQEGNITLTNVRHLVLDEADRMLDAEFMSQIEEIVASCSHTDIQKALFSATLPSSAEKMAMDMLNDPIRVVVGLKDTPLPLIKQSLTYVADDSSKLPSLLQYFAQPYNPPVLIFTSTQARSTSLTEELILNKIANVDCLHAGMTKKEREDSLNRMRRGESWIMVTTEIMGRGMDFKGVREVINYDFPTSVQSYIHRIGRTGRAGQEGKAVTFFTDEDGPYLKSIANVILQSGFTVPDWILKLPKPSKMKRRQMGKIKRPDVVNFARKIGRADAIKKREMVQGSKRRKAKEQHQETKE
ncbi:hypothetical protein CVT24_005002 [Panaeolus cyanescens]|uniref:RNA helicase n=1 Tax=Panaeolus cyanescens TaxID=181874 RepID=A0A409YB71_9AGAR|nr:hypothetical protein CVT24_005002 [Panaeolus cyanescens]